MGERSVEDFIMAARPMRSRTVSPGSAPGTGGDSRSRRIPCSAGAGPVRLRCRGGSSRSGERAFVRLGVRQTTENDHEGGQATIGEIR